jgi:alcohol dehydrogenase
MMLGPMCAFNEDVDPSRYEQVASALDATSGTASAAIAKLCADLGLKARLRDFGVREEDYDRILTLATRSDNVLANPRAAGPSEMKQLLAQAQ